MGLNRKKNSNRLKMFSESVISNISKYTLVTRGLYTGLSAKATFPATFPQEDCNRQIASINEEKCCLVICAQIRSSAHYAVSKGEKNWPQCAPGFGVRVTGARLAERVSVLEPGTHTHTHTAVSLSWASVHNTRPG